MSTTGSSTFQLRRDKQLTAVRAQKLSTSGDLSVGGKSHLNGNTTINSDLAVNGGTLSTTSLHFHLINTHAHTVHFAGAAHSLTMSSNTGHTRIRNTLSAGNLFQPYAISNGNAIAMVATGEVMTANRFYNQVADAGTFLLPSSLHDPPEDGVGDFITVLQTVATTPAADQVYNAGGTLLIPGTALTLGTPLADGIIGTYTLTDGAGLSITGTGSGLVLVITVLSANTLSTVVQAGGQGYAATNVITVDADALGTGSTGPIYDALAADDLESFAVGSTLTRVGGAVLSAASSSAAEQGILTITGATNGDGGLGSTIKFVNLTGQQSGWAVEAQMINQGAGSDASASAFS